MNVVYSARYRIDIGPHVFPTQKYSLIHARLLETGVIQPQDCVEPEPASWDELALVHTSEYLHKMRDGAMTPEDVAQLELPWSTEMVEGFRLMVGGTIQAARIACGLDEFGIQTSEFGIHIGGGFHHAFPSHGEGFCPFNDVAVAARVLQSRGLERVAIVDLDVHHGNGTAFAFESDSRVFTFSMHQQHNYPMWKPRGSLDIGLADGAHDATFIRELARALPAVLAHAPECIFYLAGADPYEDDQLGGLRLTKEGLRRRDRMVIDAARSAGIPLVIVLAGGYARHVEDTVAIHVATIEEAARSAHRSHA
ncbi:MAG TPA: histone deacetylase [Vicinamibacterales bacterium]|nr:histone deacetylase [Vicinamibacterales bacterium]